MPHREQFATQESFDVALRDYFAAKALQGLISGHWKPDINLGVYRDFSETAYQFADAMIKARQS